MVRMGEFPLSGGDEQYGESRFRRLLTTHETAPWGATRILDYSVAQSAYALSEVELWLPGKARIAQMSMAQLNEVGQTWASTTLDITGALHKAHLIKHSIPALPPLIHLWNHNAKKETRIVMRLPILRFGVRETRDGTESS